ncbi:hypothetical protein K466DRAFT_54593 [Polyporus arcularius HHB13444]|uniref:DUF6532 domain-containing protein n=1 Tax=Polyporus arcularius HHB13444 TaxID=1314778 RepID=A0A5C3PGF1_9APHY|nr:hypothetical protein K466DRAFT_54593 [Polyporus arcularius HHB13444]
MSATVIQPSTTGSAGPRSRIDQLRGSHIPIISGPSNVAEIRSLISPAVVPPPVVRTIAPRSSVASSLPVCSQLSMPGLPPHTPLSPQSPTDIAPPRTAQKRTQIEAGLDDEDERNERTAAAELRARKKDAKNAERMRYRDYKHNMVLYRIMRKAGDILQVRFATELPFPAPEERDEAVKEAFEEALRIAGQESDFYTLTQKDLNLLRSEETGIRSRIKKAAVDLVVNAYNLHEIPDGHAELSANKDRVQGLLKQSSFHYEDPYTRVGRFQHLIVSRVIWRVFFSTSNALGCVYQSSFKPISHELLALVLTAIRHVLKCWDSGRMVGEDFTGAQYRVYDQYLDALEQFDKGPLRRFWTQHRRDIFKKGLSRAGCLEQADTSETVIDLAEDDELQRELAHMQARYGFSGSTDSSAIQIDYDSDIRETSPPASSPSRVNDAATASSRLSAAAGAESADYDGEFDDEIRRTSNRLTGFDGNGNDTHGRPSRTAPTEPATQVGEADSAA